MTRSPLARGDAELSAAPTPAGGTDPSPGLASTLPAVAGLLALALLGCAGPARRQSSLATVALPAAGFYPYFCPEHVDQNMRGVIWVTATP